MQKYNSLFFSFDFSVKNDPGKAYMRCTLLKRLVWMNVLLLLKHNCRRTLCENEFALNVPLSVTQDSNMRGRSFQQRCNIQRDAPLLEWHYSFIVVA